MNSRSRVRAAASMRPGDADLGAPSPTALQEPNRAAPVMRSQPFLTRFATNPCALVVLLCFRISVVRADDTPIIYVDVHATGPVFDGSTWCSAYRQLYEALAVATAGTTIRVADGIYKPNTTGLADPRTATMTLIGGVTLEGGYAGCDAPDPDERNIELFRSTISCDLGKTGKQRKTKGKTKKQRGHSAFATTLRGGTVDGEAEK